MSLRAQFQPRPAVVRQAIVTGAEDFHRQIPLVASGGRAYDEWRILPRTPFMHRAGQCPLSRADSPCSRIAALVGANVRASC